MVFAYRRCNIEDNHFKHIKLHYLKSKVVVGKVTIVNDNGVQSLKNKMQSQNSPSLLLGLIEISKESIRLTLAGIFKQIKKFKRKIKIEYVILLSSTKRTPKHKGCSL